MSKRKVSTSVSAAPSALLGDIQALIEHHASAQLQRSTRS